MYKKILLLTLVFFIGCPAINIKKEKYTINDFERNKYLGIWYEIARKDNWFEKNMSNVKAEYQLEKNGNLKVINSGYNEKTKKFEKTIGHAYFDKTIPNILYVSFFGPFYADYIVLDIDKENYSYALVRSKNNKYLWILSRTPNLDSKIIDSLITKAKEDGISTDDLIFVNHNLSK